MILILLGSAFALYIVRNTLIPLFISMLIAYLLTPLADYLEHRGLGRILAITTTFLFFFGFIVLVVLYLFPLIRDQVVDLTTALPRTLALLNTRIDELQARLAVYWPTIEQVDVGVRIQQAALDTLNALPTYVANAFSIFPLLILVPLISFFFLKDGRRIKRGFFNSVPNRYFETVMGLHLRSGPEDRKLCARATPPVRGDRLPDLLRTEALRAEVRAAAGHLRRRDESHPLRRALHRFHTGRGPGHPAPVDRHGTSSTLLAPAPGGPRHPGLHPGADPGCHLGRPVHPGLERRHPPPGDRPGPALRKPAFRMVGDHPRRPGRLDHQTHGAGGFQPLQILPDAEPRTGITCGKG